MDGYCLHTHCIHMYIYGNNWINVFPRLHFLTAPMTPILKPGYYLVSFLKIFAVLPQNSDAVYCCCSWNRNNRNPIIGEVELFGTKRRVPNSKCFIKIFSFFEYWNPSQADKSLSRAITIICYVWERRMPKSFRASSYYWHPKNDF